MSTPTPEDMAALLFGPAPAQHVDPDTPWTEDDLAHWLVGGHRPADDKAGSTSSDKDSAD